ncbi:helix-turn-helix domain-containing protein [Colibacter massiliensis]|uniref:helix-turn-helix domain-containing protein n=1 Tax=Colibacter massiliensis TaxID=1852379 RepID=UPI003F9065EE
MAKGKYRQWLKSDGLLLLQAWARDGLTDEQIAGNMGITTKTLYEWKKKYGNICEALKRGKVVIDTEVENALLKRALGFEYKEVTHEQRYNKEAGTWEMVPTKVVTKYQVPDTTAQIFWLKNRKPEEWRDVKNIDMNAKVNNPFDGIRTEDIKKLIKNE